MSFWKKKRATEPELAAVVTDSPEVGTAADVDEVMKKYDRESNVRIWEGVPQRIVRTLMALFSLFCLYLTLFDTSLPEFRLNMFMALIVIIGFLNFPMKKGITKVNFLPWYDIAIMVVGSIPFFYFALNAEKILNTS